MYDLLKNESNRNDFEQYPGTDIRENVLNALALIHLSEVVFLKRPETPRERLAYDLLEFWLDHVYTPGMRYMDSIKGDRSDKKVSVFKEAFSEEEIDWLERFNRFLELRIDRLRPDDVRSKKFPIKDTWNGIVRDAGNLIALMEPGMYEGKKRLEKVRNEINSGSRLTG